MYVYIYMIYIYNTVIIIITIIIITTTIIIIINNNNNIYNILYVYIYIMEILERVLGRYLIFPSWCLWR